MIIFTRIIFILSLLFHLAAQSTNLPMKTDCGSIRWPDAAIQKYSLTKFVQSIYPNYKIHFVHLNEHSLGFASVKITKSTDLDGNLLNAGFARELLISFEFREGICGAENTALTNPQQFRVISVLTI